MKKRLRLSSDLEIICVVVTGTTSTATPNKCNNGTPVDDFFLSFPRYLSRERISPPKFIA